MSTSAKKVTKGKRYTPEEKKDIVAFIQSHNATNGRGGQSAASKKYGISPISLGTWVKASEGTSKAIPSKRGRKLGSLNKTKGSLSIGYSAKLGEISKLANEIDKKETEIAKLVAKFQKLKLAL